MQRGSVEQREQHKITTIFKIVITEQSVGRFQLALLRDLVLLKYIKITIITARQQNPSTGKRFSVLDVLTFARNPFYNL